MSELRRDPLNDRWVIIAENRAERPNEFTRQANRESPAEPPTEQPPRDCVFCPGNEHQTPETLLVRRPVNWNGDSAAWRIRVIANRYPAVEPTAASTVRDSPLHWSASGFGVHEVIVDTAEHVTSITHSSEVEVAELFEVYRARMLAARSLPEIAAALVFKNVGPGGGASIAHAHSQLLATAIPPRDLAEEWRAAAAHFARHGDCIFCRLIEEATCTGVRLVAQTQSAVAFCPFAARFPYETWVLPKRHESHLEHASETALAAVAGLTRRIVAGLEQLLDRPAYNYLIHSGPLPGAVPGGKSAGGKSDGVEFDANATYSYHWHVEVFPRVTTLAGFELGTGCIINSVSPERAAEQVRRALEC
jgi:UDPglucose--hexose-1-phosphate uridylyltransferase